MANYYTHPAVVALRDHPELAGTIIGPPPRGYTCEICDPKGVPQYTDKLSPARRLVIQRQRWEMHFLYRLCRKCKIIRPHFPSPRLP